MIKINNFIFNENEIFNINTNEKGNVITIVFKDNKRPSLNMFATFDDIEWNYGTPQYTQRKMQKELCKSCYYRDTISNKLKELEEEKNNMILEITKREEVMLNKEKEIAKLEEENKKLKEVQCTFCGTGCIEKRKELEEDLEAEKSTSSNLSRRILKAIEYIEQDYNKNQEIIEYCNFEDFYKRLSKILKGEENE